jgi:hypothetical protein
MNRKTKTAVLKTTAPSDAAGVECAATEIAVVAGRQNPNEQMEITVVDGVLTVYVLAEETDADRAKRLEAALTLAVLKLAAILDDGAELDEDFKDRDWLGYRAYERLHDIIAAIKENL